jgi:hypothetical protein
MSKSAIKGTKTDYRKDCISPGEDRLIKVTDGLASYGEIA